MGWMRDWLDRKSSGGRVEGVSQERKGVGERPAIGMVKAKVQVEQRDGGFGFRVESTRIENGARSTLRDERVFKSPEVALSAGVTAERKLHEGASSRTVELRRTPEPQSQRMVRKGPRLSH